MMWAACSAAARPAAPRRLAAPAVGGETPARSARAADSVCEGEALRARAHSRHVLSPRVRRRHAALQPTSLVAEGPGEVEGVRTAAVSCLCAQSRRGPDGLWWSRSNVRRHARVTDAGADAALELLARRALAPGGGVGEPRRRLLATKPAPGLAARPGKVALAARATRIPGVRAQRGRSGQPLGSGIRRDRRATVDRTRLARIRRGARGGHLIALFPAICSNAFAALERRRSRSVRVLKVSRISGTGREHRTEERTAQRVPCMVVWSHHSLPFSTP